MRPPSSSLSSTQSLPSSSSEDSKVEAEAASKGGTEAGAAGHAGPWLWLPWATPPVERVSRAGVGAGSARHPCGSEGGRRRRAGAPPRQGPPPAAAPPPGRGPDASQEGHPSRSRSLLCHMSCNLFLRWLLEKGYFGCVTLSL